jgi:hypothetical protein
MAFHTAAHPPRANSETISNQLRRKSPSRQTCPATLPNSMGLAPIKPPERLGDGQNPMCQVVGADHTAVLYQPGELILGMRTVHSPDCRQPAPAVVTQCR